MLSNSLSIEVTEQILKAQNAKRENKFIFCDVRQKERQGIYGPTHVGLQ